MKIKEYNSVGVVARFNVPETIEEFDQSAKRAGAVLDEAIDNIAYRTCLAEFREALVSKLEEATEIIRTSVNTDKKDRDGDPVVKYTETEQQYVKRVMATGLITIEEVQKIADAISTSIVFDASARERKAPTPKKTNKKWLAIAQAIIDKGDKAVGHVSQKLAKSLGHPVGGSLEELAKAIAEDVARSEAATLALLS